MANQEQVTKLRVFPIFRSSFLLTDREAFDRAVDLCRSWIARKGGACLRFPDGEPGDFTAPECRGAVRSIAHEDGRIWAARLEDLRDAGSGRNWTTDLFVEARGRALVRFGAELVLRSSAPKGERFSHSRPRVVRDILSTLSAEADGVALAETPEVVDEPGLEDFVRLLLDERRRLPVVAIARDKTGATQIDPNRAANLLAGACHVRILESDASWALTRVLGKRWSVYNRAIRLYFPGVAEEDDPYRHPLSMVSPSRPGERIIDWLGARVLPAGFRDADQDARFWRVGLLRHAAPAAPGHTGMLSHGAELEAARAERDEARREAETAEALMVEADRLREEAESELARLRDTLATLPSAPAGGGASAAQVAPLVTGGLTVAAALSLVECLFPSRLTVLPSAHAAARRSDGFEHSKKALELLWTLATAYWAELTGGKGDVEARKLFGNAYAPKEASKLSAHGRSLRTFRWNGEDIFMERHLKIGVKPSVATTLRIHFHWDGDHKRIVIGHCGPHLDF